MNMRPRTVLFLSLAAATVVFCIVQDRVTADGARQYVELQRAAAAGRGHPVTLDEIMKPAVGRSVRQATAWSLVVVVAGVAAARVVHTRSGGES